MNRNTCKNCAKFLPSNNNHDFCSEQCQLLFVPKRKIRNCPECHQNFSVKFACLTPKFCSGKCHRKNKRRVTTLLKSQCKKCGKLFEHRLRVLNPKTYKSEKSNHREFCSIHCARSLPLGAETIRKGQIMVKTGKGHLGWERKAKVVIEALACRTLSKSEYNSIRFIDGNPLNCEPENLLLPKSKTKILICPGCQRVKKVQPHNQVSDWCNSCRPRKGWSDGRHGAHRRLIPSKVAEIKFLIRIELTLSTISLIYHVSRAMVSYIKREKCWKEVIMAKLSWEALLKKEERLSQSGRAFLFDRVKLLSQVFDNPDFRKKMTASGKAPQLVLDDRLNDTGFNFTELHQMMKKFPAKLAWKTGNLSAMRLEVLKSIGVRKRSPKAPSGTIKRVRKAVTTAAFEELRHKYDSALIEIAHLKEINEARLREIVDKDERIADLRKLVKTLDPSTEEDSAPKRRRRTAAK